MSILCILDFYVLFHEHCVLFGYGTMFVSGKPFLLSLLFVSKAGVYPSEVPFRCSTIG